MSNIIFACVIIFLICFCIYSFIKYISKVTLKLVTRSIFDLYTGATYQEIGLKPYVIYLWKVQNTETFHITVTIKDTETLVASWNYNRKNEDIQIIGIIDPYFKNFLDFISKS